MLYLRGTVHLTGKDVAFQRSSLTSKLPRFTYLEAASFLRCGIAFKKS